MVSHIVIRQLSGYRGVRIDGGDTRHVNWAGTHSYGRSREHCITVASRAETYRLCEIKCDDVVEYVEQGSVPILQCCQTRHNLRYFWDGVQQRTTQILSGNRVNY